MSHEATSWAFAQRDLTTGAKFLLVAVANHANKFGVAFPGHKSLAEDCACSRKAIGANMARLEEAGLVKRVGRRRENGSRTSDWVILAPRVPDRKPMLDAPTDEFPADVAVLAKRWEETSGDDSLGNDPGGGHVTSRGGPEPSEEPEDGSSASARVPAEMAEDAAALLKAKAKVDGRVVTKAEMERAVAALAEFNKQLGSGYGIGTNLTPLVMRIRERPSWKAERFVSLVQSAFRVKWWEAPGRDARRPTPAVIFGNSRVFEAVTEDASREGRGEDTKTAQKRYTRSGPTGEKQGDG